MTKFFAILTNLGAAKLANATALGIRLDLTQLAVGDGGGTLPTPDPAQTALKGERRRAAINMLSIDPANTNQIIAEQVIPENEGGWWIREIGLFDNDGTLIAVANCPETYKPQLQEGSGRTQTIRMVLIVSSTEAVTLKIDPAVVLATRDYVDSAITAHAKSRNHPDASITVKGFVQLTNATDSDSETMAATPKAVKKAYDLAGDALSKTTGAKQVVAGDVNFGKVIRVGTIQPSLPARLRDGILVARNVTGLSDSHGVADISVLDSITDYGGYGTFDAVVTYRGDSAYDHNYSFQDRFIWEGSNSLGTAGGFLSRPEFNGTGTIQRRNAVVIEDFKGTSPVLEQYAIRIKSLEKAGVNYGIMSEGKNTRSTHGGGFAFGYPLAATGENEGIVYAGYSLQNATQVGFNCRGGGNASAIVSYTAVRAVAGAVASDTPYTIPDCFGVKVENGGLGANATISRNNGIYISALTNGVSNRAILSLTNAAADNWNLFIGGSAQNWISGNVGIGANTTAQRPPSRLYIQGGSATVPSAILGQGSLLSSPLNGGV